MSITGGQLRVVAIADADSYVKWAGALLDAVPDIRRQMVLVRTPLTVSTDQEQSALAGTRFTSDDVARVDYTALAGWLSHARPDVVVVAGRGPFVRVVLRQIDRIHPRPVVVTGMPGISIPAQRGALTYRRESDLFVIHSRREARAFDDLAGRLGVDVPVGLATLPFAQPVTPHRTGTDLVFAAQALIPTTTGERRELADILRAAAEASPSRRVVVKLRARPGEQETHFERDSFPDLLRDRPRNLVFSHQPMSAALGRAEGLVTVSSTAAIEAIACGVPVIALDSFGVSKANLNTVFHGSGLFGDADDVIARRFRHPSLAWMDENYFHDPAESTWWSQVEDLVSRRRRGELPERLQPCRRGGALREAWDRKSVLGYEDRTLAGSVAYAIGVPVREALLTVRKVRGNRGRESWSDPTTDITITPALRQDPMLRRRPVRT